MTLRATGSAHGYECKKRRQTEAALLLFLVLEFMVA
jgi:hypothetical protein